MEKKIAVNNMLFLSLTCPEPRMFFHYFGRGLPKRIHAIH